MFKRQLRTFATKMSYPISKTDNEWKAILTPQQFNILRQSGTERPFSGNMDIAPKGATGVFHCVGCDSPLYKTGAKFDSGCGWPAFYEAIPGSLDLIEDKTLGMTRVEMRCKNCGGHLGHVFKGEKFNTPTDERHCVNGTVLNFKPEE